MHLFVRARVGLLIYFFYGKYESNEAVHDPSSDEQLVIGSDLAGVHKYSATEHTALPEQPLDAPPSATNAPVKDGL